MNIKADVLTLISSEETNDPFLIAKSKKITVLFEELGTLWGYHNYDSRFHFIHINQSLDGSKQNFTCAHELGHVIYHPHENTTFLKNVTLFPVDRMERQAHTFAVELLLRDELIRSYPGHSIYKLAQMVGIPEKLVDLKKFTP